MFYVFEAHGTPEEGDLATIYGNSSEEKPVDVADGSVFVETDTQKVYMLDKDGPQWREMA